MKADKIYWGSEGKTVKPKDYKKGLQDIIHASELNYLLYQLDYALQNASKSGTNPIGTLIFYAGNVTDADYKEDGVFDCNGNSYDEKSNPKLTAIIGSIYGKGKVPQFNKEGVFFRSIGKSGGNIANPLGKRQEQSLAKHKHTYTACAKANSGNRSPCKGASANVGCYTGYTGETETKPVNYTIKVGIASDSIKNVPPSSIIKLGGNLSEAEILKHNCFPCDGRNYDKGKNPKTAKRLGSLYNGKIPNFNKEGIFYRAMGGNSANKVGSKQGDSLQKHRHSAPLHRNTGGGTPKTGATNNLGFNVNAAGDKYETRPVSYTCSFVIAGDNATLPPSAIVDYAGNRKAEDMEKDGCLYCSSTTPFDKQKYSNLAKAINGLYGNKLPNFNNEAVFFRALGGHSANKVGSKQGDVFKSHNHSYNKAYDFGGTARASSQSTGQNCSTLSTDFNSKDLETRPVNYSVVCAIIVGKAAGSDNDNAPDPITDIWSSEGKIEKIENYKKGFSQETKKPKLNYLLYQYFYFAKKILGQPINPHENPPPDPIIDVFACDGKKVKPDTEKIGLIDKEGNPVETNVCHLNYIFNKIGNLIKSKT